MPSLCEALEAGGIHYRVGGTDKPTVLASVVELLRLPDRVDREALLQILLAREEQGSTGIGNGIAIPHVRNPIVVSVSRPTITLCFLERPIEFGALDGAPVDVLFSMICPTIQAHLHLLSRLSFILRAQTILDLLRRQASREEIMEALRGAESQLMNNPINNGTGR
jgi:PTS system nitrogen regulatory IIA component